MMVLVHIAQLCVWATWNIETVDAPAGKTLACILLLLWIPAITLA